VTDCDFNNIDLTCQKCGFKGPSRSARKRCSGKAQEGKPRKSRLPQNFELTGTGAPPFLKKAANFAASAAKHVAAGMPQATDEQVAARFAICQGCEHFDGSACKQCGCPIVRQKKFLSKLSWADSECPVGKWGPVSS
jgi:hypothetical protein